jgi:hypothetical protein
VAISQIDSETEDPRVRSIELERERKLARARREKSKANREAKLKTGEAAFVSPREYSQLSGISIATTYRRVRDGTLKHKPLVGQGKKHGRVLIYRDQLG